MCDDKCVHVSVMGTDRSKALIFKYDGKRVPVGWGEWNGLLRNSRFYNYSLNVNGKIFFILLGVKLIYLLILIVLQYMSLMFVRHSLCCIAIS